MKRFNFLRKTGAAALAAAMLLPLAACGGAAGASSSAAGGGQDNSALTFDSAKWNYDADNDVYWQIGVSYCAAPQAPDYETMTLW